MSNKKSLGKAIPKILEEQTQSKKQSKNEHYTPPYVIELVKEVLGVIDLDPFSCKHANENYVKAEKYFDAKDDACKQEWECKKLYSNPPYSDGLYAPAIEAILRNYKKFQFEGIILTNCNTDTAATQSLMKKSSAYCFPNHRINFFTENGKTSGNRHWQMVSYLGKDVSKFIKAFSTIGQCAINPSFFWLQLNTAV